MRDLRSRLQWARNEPRQLLSHAQARTQRPRMSQCHNAIRHSDESMANGAKGVGVVMVGHVINLALPAAGLATVGAGGMPWADGH
jgi:hypothetical protein